MKPAAVIVGLGNPGRSYECTRHNVGFMAIELFGGKFGLEDWRVKQKFSASVMDAMVDTVPVLLVKPLTYMNRSGECVRKIIDFFGIDASRLIIIADDIDLKAGEIRFKPSGGAGTHNGLRSVAGQCGKNFPRIRVGIRGDDAPQEHSFRQSGNNLAAYVMSRPSDKDGERIKNALTEVMEAVRRFVLGVRQ